MKNNSLLPVNPTFAEVVDKLLRHKWRIVTITAGVTLVGIAIVLAIPRRYTAQSEIVAEHNGMSRSGLGGAMGMLGGLAGLGDEEPGGITLDMAPSIVASIPFLLGLADIPIESSLPSGRWTLGDWVMNHQRVPWWRAIFGHPKPVTLTTEFDNYTLSKPQQSFIKRAGGMIAVATNKKTGKLTLTATTQDPLVSAIVVDTLTSRLQSYLVEYQTRKAREKVTQLTAMAAAAQGQYHAAQNVYTRSMDHNQDLVRQSARATQERLSNELSIALQLYTGLALKLEQARTRVLDNTPSFTVLSPPIMDKSPTAPKRKMVAVVSLLVGFFLAVASVLVPDIWHSLTHTTRRA